MDKEAFIEIELGSSFLINAGICGLMRLLKFAEAQPNKDYIVQEQSIWLSKEFITSNDLAELYVKTMVNEFYPQTKYSYLLDKRSKAEMLYHKEDKSKDELKMLDDIYKEMVGMLDKNSFKAGYEIILQEYGDTFSQDKYLILKKSKNDEERFKAYIELCEWLLKPRVCEVLVMKELMYSKINMFYEGTSFFLPANLKKSITECYRKDFIEPLLEQISSKQGKKRCIECSNLAVDTKSISFMIDTTDDVARKKSHYWNLKADAFACPVCSFLYTLVPLGFHFCGSDAVFINNNHSIDVLTKFMDTYRGLKDEEDGISARSKLFRIFTVEGLDMIQNKTNCIQVVVRMQNKDHYEMTLISRDLIKGFKEGRKQLAALEKKKLYIDKNFYSVYDEVLVCLLEHRNLYALMDKYFRHELDNGTSTRYIRNILELQMIFKGGQEMDKLMDYVNIAFSHGKRMRNELTDATQEKEKDNALRGFIYKLSNSLSVKNVNQFIDIITRVYSGKGVPIPGIFRECYQSDEVFQAIGRGYILGLKYEKYVANDKGNEE